MIFWFHFASTAYSLVQRRGALSITVLLLVLGGTSRPLLADPNPADGSRPRSAEAKPGTAGALVVTPAREAAVLAFVDQHHPELRSLLVHLKELESKEYVKAIRDLFRVSERLAASQERDPERYELELESWKVQSRIDLLAARISMDPGDGALREGLRALLEQRVDLKLTLLRREYERVSQRAEKLEQQMQMLERQRERHIEQQLKALTAGKVRNSP